MVKVIPSISANLDDSAIVKKNSDKLKDNTKSWISRCFNDFASNTALHGYNHIVREDTSKWERRAWATIVIIATIVSIILLWVSWNWNAETPTVTVIESTHFPIWNVPFPAITICSLNKISASAALNVAKNMQRPTDMPPEKLSRLFSLALHFQGIGNASRDEYDQLHNILRTNQMSVEELMSLLVPKCVDLIERCSWKSTLTRCEALFQQINTTEGVCCSFNYYGLATNNFQMKWAQSMPPEPRSVTACGFQTGLTIIVKPMISDYHSTFFSSYGIRVFIHDPYDYMDDNAETKAVSAKMEAFISVSPESTYSTDDVRQLPIYDRNCYFENEIKLNVMQRYSYGNCLAECRSEIIFKLCGCVPYNLPNNGTYPICQMNQIACVQKNKHIYIGALPGLNRTYVTLSNVDITDTPCKCLPDCQLNQYPSEITSAYLNRTFAFSSSALFKGINLSDQSIINVFFGDLVSTRYRKDVYQNWLGMLASFGGLLGLLLGFSFVTGFELIYFFTIRVIFDRFTD